ncbi:MarR family winged helix-turn-helix transcriptional regulator [Methylocapsa palsarum]|uniref:DNA-binding transcriptional regulator, MarR family n=1 Tax=Methylocapsa palsarum TaxID=1612308 RepID=A0A1I3WG67_9HYPH|nr:MarR family winged helix-turn-helix transcriptional regulator [Methylocapsa palsarum]SFK05446.1 DNA-binding transcriptional regulator, MarR family [Methylocapsa palsarum]
MTPFDALSTPVYRRLREGLDRIGAAMRADQWGLAEDSGLSPTQAHVLAFVAGRGAKGMRVRSIAEHLGVAQPTATESIAALVRKGLLTKASDPDDARAASIQITGAGQEIVRGIGLAMTSTERALETLSSKEQTMLLHLVIKTIRALQIAGAIPPQRVCISCRYFRANVHDDAELPHHCAYVDAPFGGRHLRLDCNEHGEADQGALDQAWKAFSGIAYDLPMSA